MSSVLHIVTGAPGSGKSTTLAAFLELRTPFVAFDIDWLTIPASNLAGNDIIFEPSTWPAYNALWFTILDTVARNHKQPVFFAPTSPDDLVQHHQPLWSGNVRWLLLDCPDDVRRQRLRQRPEWTEPMIAEAIADAASLRQTVALCIDTAAQDPEQVADAIRHWVEDA